MIFTQIEFILFYVVALLFLLVVRHHRTQKVFLLLASYYFYAYWDWRFLSLIIISTIVDFWVGRKLKNEDHSGRRKTLLLVSLICNLGKLGFFKYFNFFIHSFDALLEPMGLHIGSLNIILPIGISFYTFQTLSYTIDVYRRNIDTCSDFFDFALFVAFFPQLVAGPIVRASDFLPQLKSAPKITWSKIFLGFQQFVFGLFKKVFIADRIAFYVDGVFDDVNVLTSFTVWLGVIAYAIQIYCDFSGYSDMAIGVARSFGYDLQENFRHPYISRSVTEFWRRWHISLSTWLRDYLYIPLGGNRKGTRRMYINLMLTMLLGGLWHGAAWTFVLWGFWHGLALVTHRRITSLLNRIRPTQGLTKILWNLTAWAVTMLIVLLGWVFFRANSFSHALIVLRQMFCPLPGFAWYYPFVLGIIPFFVFIHALHSTRFAYLKNLPPDKWYGPAILFILVFLTIAFYPSSFQPFIYFQF